MSFSEKVAVSLQDKKLLIIPQTGIPAMRVILIFVGIVEMHKYERLANKRGYWRKINPWLLKVAHFQLYQHNHQKEDLLDLQGNGFFWLINISYYSNFDFLLHSIKKTKMI